MISAARTCELAIFFIFEGQVDGEGLLIQAQAFPLVRGAGSSSTSSLICPKASFVESWRSSNSSRTPSARSRSPRRAGCDPAFCGSAVGGLLVADLGGLPVVVEVFRPTTCAVSSTTTRVKILRF
jgi:hypothetical protein